MVFPWRSLAASTRGGDAGADPASIRISVPVQEQRRVIEGVWHAGGEIISLAPLRRRLEDLFLEWSGASVAQNPAVGESFHS